ncbi:MAG: hypothetical protein P8K08_19180 [Fuerstiella sp.]|jgi:hypothetical protein|nr:hypothetical protein [Fuerstiella sp.]
MDPTATVDWTSEVGVAARKTKTLTKEIGGVNPAWRFSRVSPRFKNREATQGEFFAADTELRALIRKSVQNSPDAKRPDCTGPVAV